MRRIAKLTVAVALSLAALTNAARSQLPGVPVYYNPQGSAGVGMAANLGFPFRDAGGGIAIGLAGSLGTGPVTLTAMAGLWTHIYEPDARTYAGALAYRVYGGGVLPLAVAVQAGYGTVTSTLGGSTTTTTIPVGVGIAFDPQRFPLQPWIAPRIELTSLKGAPSGNASAVTFRVSAGVNLSVRPGLGLHAAMDYGIRPASLDPNGIPTRTKSATPFLVSVGVHYSFHEAGM